MPQSTESTAVEYNRVPKPDFPAFEQEIRDFWAEQDFFRRSIEEREEAPAFTFYEGPPSANGTPGIHHMMARALKDLVCRYKTMRGYQVRRKAGWDTHGLPVELQVEKELGITKRDIGKQISVADYNKRCREAVMRYKDQWDELTRQMGFWIDLDDPYVTFEQDYIESVWALLKRFYDNGLLYRGRSIQPYSPAAGTGLSSHELNQPGCYREVKDTAVTAMFKWNLTEAEQAEHPYDSYFLAWTTTPWTLPSNAALAVGPKIEYADIETLNPYTTAPVRVTLAVDAIPRYFDAAGENGDFEAWKALDSKGRNKTPLPWKRRGTCTGNELLQMFGDRKHDYEPLFELNHPDILTGDKVWKVIPGDFVTTEDGTGIVHIAPTFGADDKRVGEALGIDGIKYAVAEPGAPDAGHEEPLVDKEGKFHAGIPELGGRYVRPEYDGADGDVNVDISVKLKKEGKAFLVEKYTHSYPHCWRTDKPVLYYPLESWFIRTSAYRERLVELNQHINWKPEGTGTGRFGNWLENLVDWNLSRSRYWGTPLPIWENEDSSEQVCIGSVGELRERAAEAVQQGLMERNPADSPDFDLHKPHVDDVILPDSQGRPMKRVPDLIDVWFDSGAMPFAQWHYPFENEDVFHKNFPADFIAEGVDQTRGWFFTLHAIATLLEDRVAYRNVIANGLVLDKDGEKMSKRKGNVIDPFETIASYGADTTRWYMIENAPPWENLRFNLKHLEDAQRRFFGTLFYTYDFFALYAGIDNYAYAESAAVPVRERSELDRWLVSTLQTTLREVLRSYDDYDPTRALRLIAGMVTEQLSNWYVRLSRRRFWRGEMNRDKQAAYDTLYETLLLTAQLMAPAAPHFSEWLYRRLTVPLRGTGQASEWPESVHLSLLPEPENACIDTELETRMELAQRISNLGRSIRKKAKIKQRQPLGKVMIPVLSAADQQRLEAVDDLIRSELNVKAVEYVSGKAIQKQAKPNFKVLGPRLGSGMKQVAQAVGQLTQEDITRFEQEGRLELSYGASERIELGPDDLEVTPVDIPGMSVASDGRVTVAIDLTLTEELEQEGLAREYVHRIQSLRRDSGLDVTDRIELQIAAPTTHHRTIDAHKTYICAETLALNLELAEELAQGETYEIEGESVRIHLQRTPSN